MMTNEDIQRLADEMGVDINYSILTLPIEEQKIAAKELGYSSFEEYVKELLERFLERQIERETEKAVPVRQFLDEHPLEQRYTAAGFCGRVFAGDLSPEEVLKAADYSEAEIAEIIQTAKDAEEALMENVRQYHAGQDLGGK